MRRMNILGFVAIIVAPSAQAPVSCSAPLTIDDFSKWSSHTNALDSWTSDDGTMTSIMAGADTLYFTPKADSLFYETFACQAFSSRGYSSVVLTVKGPVGGSLTVKLKTKSSCSSASAAEGYSHAISGLTGSTQTITIPFSYFGGANTDAIVGLCLEDFSSTAVGWELCNIQFGCDGDSGEHTSSSSVSASEEVTSTSGTVPPHTTASSTTTSSTTDSTSKTTSSSSSSSTTSSSSSGTITTSSSTTPSSTSYSSSSTSYTPSSTTFSSSSTTFSSSSASTTSACVETTEEWPTETGFNCPTPSESHTRWSTPAWARPTCACKPLVVEDWSDQQRVECYYCGWPGCDWWRGTNLLREEHATFSMNTTFNESGNRVTWRFDGRGSGMETGFGCFNATARYAGVQVRMSVPAGWSFDVVFQRLCYGEDLLDVRRRVPDAFGWVFDGTERLYTIPFQPFLDEDPLGRYILESLSVFEIGGIGGIQPGSSNTSDPDSKIVLGPIELYCRPDLV